MGRSPARVVNAGVDTFVINAYYADESGAPVKWELPDDLAGQLEEWKRCAQGEHASCPTDLVFNGKSLLMEPNGAGRGQWQWMLKTSDITFYVSRGMWNGIAAVRFNSDFLWSRPLLSEAIVEVHSFLYDIFKNPLHLQPSAVDLCADIAGWRGVERLNKRRNFVSHSRLRDGHSEGSLKVADFSYGLHETGFDFSQHGPMSLVIYDKTREIKGSSKGWFEPLWESHGWNRAKHPQVWRVEARFKREVLRDVMIEGQFHGIEDAYEIEGLLPVLWAYAVGHVQGGADGLPDGWLRCVVPSSEDTNRARWLTHPAWKVVQRAFTQGLETPPYFGTIIRKAKEEHNIEKGLEALLGYASSIASWSEGELVEPGVDLSVFLHWLAKQGPKLLEKRGRDFSDEVQRKRVKFGKARKTPRLNADF